MKENLPAIREDLSPAVYLAKLTPFRVTDLPDRTIYAFVRIPDKSKEAARAQIAKGANAKQLLTNSNVQKNCAYICVMKLKKNFQIGFFPDEDAAQVINDLPLSELPQAVADLKAAGF